MPQKSKEPPKACKRCSDADAISTEKYCKGCKKAVLSELKSSGYLSDEKPPKTFSDERGRNAMNSKVLGGAAEMGTDGDNW
jgi:predicted amidophosphoribosyltransferase